MFLASSLWQVFVFTLLGSGKFVEKVCDEWVLSASVCGTGSFSAHTATHSISGSAHETQTFSTDLRKQKKITNTCHKLSVDLLAKIRYT